MISVTIFRASQNPHCLLAHATAKAKLSSILCESFGRVLPEHFRKVSIRFPKEELFRQVLVDYEIHILLPEKSNRVVWEDAYGKLTSFLNGFEPSITYSISVSHADHFCIKRNRT